MVLGWVKVTLSGDTRITPSLTTREEYNDNIVMRIRNPQDDHITIISPNIKYDHKTERLSSSINLGLTQWLYTTETDLNTLDHKYTLDGTYQITPRLGFNTSGSYLRDTTLEQELLETGYAAMRTDRERATGSAGLSFQITERTTLDVNYSNFHAWYDYQYYPDTVVHRGLMNGTHQLKNLRTSALWQAAYTHYGYENAESHDYEFMLGLKHFFSETFDITGMGGIHYMRSQYRRYTFEWLFEFPFFRLVPIERKETQTNVGWVADVNVTKRFERSNIGLGFSRDVVDSAYGYTVERTRASCDLSYQFSERLRGSFSGGYYLTKSESGVYKIDWSNYRLRSTLKYKFSNYITPELTYQYMNMRNRRLDIVGTRNMIALLLRFTWSK